MRQITVLVALLLATTLLSWLLPRIDRPPTKHQIALQLLADQRPDDAVLLFDSPAWRGVAEYRAGRYGRAVGEFFPADNGVDLYNLGTTLAHLQDWSGAAAALEKVLRLDPEHDDARHNLELVLQAAALDAEQAAQPPEKDSPLRDESGTEHRETGEDDGQAKEQRASDAHDNDTPSVEADIERQGNSDQSGELIELGETETAGSSDLAGDPEQRTQRTVVDQRGTAQLKSRELQQAAEILLRQITDNPEKVLRVRLYTAHQNRQPQAKR